MTVIDDDTFRVIETIGIIVGILAGIGAVIVFFINLRNRVNNLENQIRDHPLLAFYTQYIRNRGVLDFFDNILRGRESGGGGNV